MKQRYPKAGAAGNLKTVWAPLLSGGSAICHAVVASHNRHRASKWASLPSSLALGCRFCIGNSDGFVLACRDTASLTAATTMASVWQQALSRVVKVISECSAYLDLCDMEMAVSRPNRANEHCGQDEIESSAIFLLMLMRTPQTRIFRNRTSQFFMRVSILRKKFGSSTSVEV